MPRYYFNLRDAAGGVTDPEGADLHDEAAARDYAVQVTRELMSRAEAKRRHWQLDVCDGSGRLLFSVPFVAADNTIPPLSPETRRLVERMCQNHRELGEAIFEARLAVLRSRATCARSNGKPHLAAQFGQRI
jgi:hypothetical protein